MPQMYSFDGIKRSALVPSGGTNSSPINVPRNVQAITIYIPVTLTSATWKIQTLSPADPEQNPVWMDAFYLDITTPATPKQLAAIAFVTGGQALTIFNNMFGGGVIRFVTASAEAADRNFHVLFNGFQN